MPALAKAVVGDFTSEIEVTPESDRRVAELLVGVQVLLDVINEKIEELEQANAELAESRDHSVTLLDEVLRKSLE